MDTKQIIIFSVAMAFVAFRLYQKYYKKNTPGSTDANKGTTGNALSNSKDDDYEPYAKK